MTRTPLVVGSLLLIAAPLAASAATRLDAFPGPCAPAAWGGCGHAPATAGTRADDAPGSRRADRTVSTVSATRWIAPHIAGGSNTFHASRTGTETSSVPLNGAGQSRRDRDFAPGESTPAGQHAVEWTLLTAPLAAYALSPAIDHRLHYESSGIWTRKYQLDFEHLVMLTEIGGALWYGGRSRIGKTFWRSVDASLFTAATTTAMKYAFSRARPRQSKSPDHWFQGNCCQSFPSGEVSFQASFVTPFIAEYHKDHPWVWALEALPAYDAIARMKTHGHWQTDVLASWAIGTAWGLYAHDEHNPLILSFMPHGVMVGLHEDF